MGDQFENLLSKNYQIAGPEKNNITNLIESRLEIRRDDDIWRSSEWVMWRERGEGETQLAASLQINRWSNRNKLEQVRKTLIC